MQTLKKDIMVASKRGEGPPIALLVELVAQSLPDCSHTKDGSDIPS